MEIDSFQFLNLVQNRVPFVLVRCDRSEPQGFGPLEKRSIENLSVFVDSSSWDQTRIEKKWDPSTPMVFVCETGTHSNELHQLAQRQGFLNSFFLAGGWTNANAQT